MKQKNKRNLPLLVCFSLLLLLLLVIIGYVAYVFGTYHRIPDRQAEEATHLHDESEAAHMAAEPGVTYTAVTYNIGFGAYTPEFSFFMDGGKQSWAASKESVIAATQGAAKAAAAQKPDLLFIEELDRGSTREYHVDQLPLVLDELPERDSVYTLNYDSPFLFYPFTQPHGKSLSGLLFTSRFHVTSSLRRSLPISESVQKILDLDRCYLVSRIPMTDGRELVTYTVHMTAYTSDPTVLQRQWSMLIEDMTAEYTAGNAVICGGDFNSEMLQPEDAPALVAWARPIKRSLLGGMVNAWDTDAVTDHARQTFTCRDAGEPYTPGQTLEWHLDGFVVSPNVVVESLDVVGHGYAYSDHQPVVMQFRIE